MMGMTMISIERAHVAPDLDELLADDGKQPHIHA